MYGGAAGGGKSVALLIAALQYAIIPGYAALMLRRTFPDLTQPKSLIPLSQEWLANTDAKYNGQEHRWYFPNGSTLTFGYLDTEQDKYQYQGAAFQGLFFDELTQFTETQYTYLISRLRRSANSNIPLRIRATSNPGGIGHQWVYQRFVNEETKMPGRVFIPARLEDNPFLDVADYELSLAQLDYTTRMQLRHGDWTARADTGLFKRTWFKFYKDEGEYYRLFRDDQQWLVPKIDCIRLGTLDVAATAKKTSDKSALHRWDITPSYAMVLADRWSDRADIPNVVSTVAERSRTWELSELGVEWAHAGIAVCQTLRGLGLPVRALMPKGDKAQRAQQAMIRAEAAQVFLPLDKPWVPEFIDQCVAFTGKDGEPDDDVDAFAYAAMLVQRRGGTHRTTEDNQHAASKQVEIEQSEDENERHPGTQIQRGAVAQASETDDEELTEWMAGK